MKRPFSVLLVGCLVSAIPLSPVGAEEKGPAGYAVFEAMAGTVNGEVIFLSDVVRESCLRVCRAYPGDEQVVLLLSEARDRLIADLLVMQEQEKLGLGAVDNAALHEAAARASEIMERCPFPCAREISGEQVRAYAARRLLVRDFLRKRVSVFVDVSKEEVEREVRRRISRGEMRPEDISEETVRKELLEEKEKREIRNWFDRATSKSRILLSPMEER